MAYARKKKVEYEQISLELTPKEAGVLVSLIGGFVNGDSQGPRGDTDSIWNALRDAGIDGRQTVSERSCGMVTLVE